MRRRRTRWGRGWRGVWDRVATGGLLLRIGWEILRVLVSPREWAATPEPAEEGDGRRVGAALGRLARGDEGERGAALDELRQMPIHSVAAEPMHAALFDPSPSVRRAALGAWAEHGGTLFHLAHRRDEANIHDPSQWQAYPMLGRLLFALDVAADDPDEGVAREALWTLATLSGPPEVEFEPWAGWWAGLLPLDETDSVLSLVVERRPELAVAQLGRPPGRVAARLVRALVETGHAEGFPLLDAMMKDPRPEFRLAAAGVYVDFARSLEGARQKLKPVRRDEDRRVRLAMGRTMREFEGELPRGRVAMFQAFWDDETDEDL